MRENELIGLITCLSRAPRTASAQALEDTELQKVSFEVLRKALDDIPHWIRNLLKEYSNRLNEALKLSTNQTHQIDDLAQQMVNTLYFSKVIAGILSMAFIDEDIRMAEEGWIPYEDVVTRLSMALTISSSEIEKILNIFIDEGILVVKVDPNLKRNTISLKSLEKNGKI